ncbi:tRNA lysidine(34) synthetase TilS [Endozoicomonas sp. (ex Bugula neritina AB1)]|nr:tRNA lysidine(34) synthetase TilS [Endozoicomonas sp. (ex Bugula neritina AB1)]
MSTKNSPNGLSPESIAPLFISLRQTPVTVAFSGGVDSTVVLHMLVALRQQGILDTVEALHIHHGLSECADQWAAFCEHVCALWNVPLTLARITVPEDTGEGIEQAARMIRYRIFEQQVMGGGCLVMGHHLDDQAETVLLRLFRGTGLEGLSGIPQSRVLGEGQILRPLLDTRRHAIEQYARDHRLDWIEDDSNNNERFSRNFLRQRIIPELEQRWPGAARRIASLTTEISAVKQVMHDRVAEAMEQCHRHEKGWWADYTLLNIQSFRLLNSELQKQVFRFWLKSHTGSVLGREQLDKVFNELIDARQDAEPQMKVGDYILRRFRGELYITSIADECCYDIQVWVWPISEYIVLKDGLRIYSYCEGDIELPDKQLRVLRREHISGSEKIAVAGREGRKTLKRWLQDFDLPPWCRNRQPFVFDGDQMIAAPGLWVCPSYQGKNASGVGLSCVKV